MVLQIHLLAPTEQESCARLLEMIEPKQGAVVADMGSGYGTVAAYMYALRPDLQFICVNNDAEQLSHTKVGYRLPSDIQASGIPTGTCDVVMFNYSIGYADLDKAFAEAHRILKPLGTLFIWDFVGDSPLLLEKLNYAAHSVQDFQTAAKGFRLDWVKHPPTHTDVCYAAIPADDVTLLKAVEKEVVPTAFRFTKVKIGLAFSGGKDSWACLMMNRARLDEITVFWVNAGKNYPETLESVAKARDLCPNFVEISTDRESQNNRWGLPVDVVPINWTLRGQMVTGVKSVMLQPYLDCCQANIAWPLNEAVTKHGITHLITGQRNDERHRAPVVNGDMVMGVERIQPLENWTSEQVLDYLKPLMPIPAQFALKHSSMDCYDCTAYCADTQDRVEYTKQRHPELHQAFVLRMDRVRNALDEAMGELHV